MTGPFATSPFSTVGNGYQGPDDAPDTAAMREAGTFRPGRRVPRAASSGLRSAMSTAGHPNIRSIPAPGIFRNVWTIATAPYPEAHFATFPPALAKQSIKADCPPGGTVLDPFGGAATTALVADRMQRDAISIELNAEYIELARQRIAADAPLFTDVDQRREVRTA